MSNELRPVWIAVLIVSFATMLNSISGILDGRKSDDLQQRIDALETIVAGLAIESMNEQLGRSYLDGRPAVEIDRSPVDVDSHRPRAP